MKNKYTFSPKIFLLFAFTITLMTANAQDWIQQGQDINGEASDDQSGFTVSISSDGSTVAVGAHNNDGNGTSSGHVRVYQNFSGTWIQKGADIDGEAAGDGSGNSLCLNSDGTIIAIGAQSNDGAGTNAGHVRVYEYVSENWAQIGSDIDGDADYDNFGASVSLSADGTVVAIGASHNDASWTNAGHVKVFQNNAGSWQQIGSDINGEAQDDLSGSSVSLSADGLILAVGAEMNDGTGTDSGHVRVYQNNSGTWQQIGADINGEASNDYSGKSVCLNNDGSVVAIGATGNDGNLSNSGHVRVIQWNGSNWIQIGNDINGEAPMDNSGYSVSVSADGLTVSIGATANDGNGSSSGHVRVYRFITGTWTQIGSDIDGEAAWDNFGISASLSSDGEKFIAGAPYNQEGGVYYGHARIFIFGILPTVTIHPVDQINICSGVIVDFSVTGDNVDTYQWQVSTDGGSLWSDISDNATYSGAITSNLGVTTNISLNDNQYRCNLINNIGTASSDAAILNILEIVNPVPTDLAIDVSTTQVLTWDDMGALSYDVYFGESGSMTFINNQVGLSYDPGTLNFSTEHKWQILPVTADGTVLGCAVWSFTTENSIVSPEGGGTAFNDDNALPNLYAILDINVSTKNKGVLIPRLTSAERRRHSMGASEEGLTVYDTDTDSFWLWNGTEWTEFLMISIKGEDLEEIIELEKIIEKQNKTIETILIRLNTLELK